MASTLEILEEEPISKSRVQKEAPALKKTSYQSPEPRKNKAFLFFLLFLIPSLTFGVVLWMTGEIRSQIGDSLVWEHTGEYWAGLYRRAGQIFCLGLLAPALVSVLRRKPSFVRTSAGLAVLFALLSFAFAFRAPKTLPPAAPVLSLSKPEVEPEPAPGVEQAPVIVSPRPVSPAPRRSRSLILFPVFTKTEKALSIVFPLHAQVRKESGVKRFWLFPYFSQTVNEGEKTIKTSSFLYPVYVRTEIYSGDALVSAKKRFLFFRSK